MQADHNIQKYRKKKKLTQKELAERLQTTSQVISNWERGYTKLNSEDIQKISTVLDISSDKILNINFPFDLAFILKEEEVFYNGKQINKKQITLIDNYLTALLDD